MARCTALPHTARHGPAAAAPGVPTRIVGVPKTIDGDLKNKDIPISFGFDTACKVRSRAGRACAIQEGEEGCGAAPLAAGATWRGPGCAALPRPAGSTLRGRRAPGPYTLPYCTLLLPLQVYSQLIGNIMVDSASAGKYYHFVRCAWSS